MKNFVYKAFGLIIESEIEIPEFIISEGKPDVYIGMGEVPDQLPSPHFVGVRFQAAPNQFILKVDRIAKYFVEGGNTITIQPYTQEIGSDIRLFLLGSAFGALFHQRGMLPIHGSSLLFDKKAIIFSGSSGAGKSTLAAGFIKRGYSLLSDDISVVSLNDQGNASLSPGYPNMKLWADSLEKLGMDPQNYNRVRSQLNKHSVPVSSKIASDSFPIAGIYVLTTKNSEGFTVEALKGIEKFNAVKNNTYRLNFINGLRNNESHFKHLSVLTQMCFVKVLSRPTKGFSLEELLTLLENDIHDELNRI